MSRVEWTRREPEEIETVLAILLCRENPAAQRVRPAKGDHGIDVYVPTSDGWVVYQIKSFTESLTGSHKRQITKSWSRFLAYVAQRKIKVKEWYCVRPLHATMPDRDWLAELTGNPGFPCEWKGLAFCEGLVAKFPDVVDYYLFDGKERLRETVEVFLRAAGFAHGGVDLFHPSDAYPTLEALHAALNAFDPHYYYDFSVDTVREGEVPQTAPPADGLVAAAIQHADGRAITFRIYARFAEAPLERPIPGQFTVSAAPGSAAAEAWEDFLVFGVPVDSLPVTAMSLDLPGGLGVETAQGEVSLGPVRLDGARPFDLVLLVVDADGAELAQAVVKMEPPTVGVSGDGIALHGTESSGVFELDLRIRRPSDEVGFSLHSLDFTGAAPADVLPALHVLVQCRPPNQLQLAFRNGPSLGEPMAIPEPLPGAEQSRRVLRVCEALATIQRATVAPVAVPDLTQATTNEARAWVYAARLLAGEVIEEQWSEARLTFTPDADLPTPGDGPGPAEFAVPLRVLVDGRELDLGWKRVELSSAIVLEVDAEQGVVLVEPGDDDRARYSLAPDGRNTKSATPMPPESSGRPRSTARP